MKFSVGTKYLIEVIAPRGLGAGQIVRVYRRLLFFRRRLSSDWFLDRGQAEHYARKVAKDLAVQDSGDSSRPATLR